MTSRLSHTHLIPTFVSLETGMHLNYHFFIGQMKLNTALLSNGMLEIILGTRPTLQLSILMTFNKFLLRLFIWLRVQQHLRWQQKVTQHNVN